MLDHINETKLVFLTGLINHAKDDFSTRFIRFILVGFIKTSVIYKGFKTKNLFVNAQNLYLFNKKIS